MAYIFLWLKCCHAVAIRFLIPQCFFCSLLVLIAIATATATATEYNTDHAIAYSILKLYERKAGSRITKWRNFIHKGKSEKWDVLESLKQVNDYFNNFVYMSDISLWGRDDYWALPIEFIGAGGGDCEDYSIAKYYSLVELGIPEEKLRLVYVKALNYDKFHVVVAYYPTPFSTPLILDNASSIIKPLTGRVDLVPVFSFNRSYLWLLKKQGSTQLVGRSSRLQKWRDLMSRKNSGQVKLPLLMLN